MSTSGRLWSPPECEHELDRTVAVIVTFTKHDLAHDLVEDCAREGVRVVVVDNGGGYTALRDEEVTSPISNIGWLRGNNLAISNLLQEVSWDRAVLLNDDTRLSAHFFGGLIWAEAAEGASIVSASYDDVNPLQRPEELLSDGGLVAEHYIPRPRNIPTGACDGTAVAIRREVFERNGLMDQISFGIYGWGGLEDLCFRARERDQRIIITRAAYVHHIGGGHQTAKELWGDQFFEHASTEGKSGMAAKWGHAWRSLRSVPTKAEVDRVLRTALEAQAASGERSA